jgi:hypothetical protein
VAVAVDVGERGGVRVPAVVAGNEFAACVTVAIERRAWVTEDK